MPEDENKKPEGDVNDDAGQKEEGKEGDDTPSEPVKDKIEQANEVVDRLEAANKKTEELTERQEKARANDILSGRAEAGSVPLKEPTEKEKTLKMFEDKYKEMGIPFTTDKPKDAA